MPRVQKAIPIPDQTPTTECSEEDLIPIAPLTDVQNIEYDTEAFRGVELYKNWHLGMF